MKKLTSEDDMNTDMIIKYRTQSGDAAKKTGDMIILRNINLARAVAAKYRHVTSHLSMSDLINEGIIGLIEARDRFDPDLGYEFSTYATYWVRRNILRALSATGRTIRVPERIAIALPRLRRAINDYVLQYGCEPDIEELANVMGLSKSVAMSAYEVLNEPASMTDVMGNVLDIESEAEPVDQTALNRVRGTQLRRAIRQTLDDRESAIIMGRFGLGDDEREYTLTELGDQLNMSREGIRQIEISAMAKLRRALGRI